MTKFRLTAAAIVLLGSASACSPVRAGNPTPPTGKQDVPTGDPRVDDPSTSTTTKPVGDNWTLPKTMRALYSPLATETTAGLTWEVIDEGGGEVSPNGVYYPPAGILPATYRIRVEDLEHHRSEIIEVTVVGCATFVLGHVTPGADERLGSADDVTRVTQVYTHPDMTTEWNKGLKDAGRDGIWLTEDDTVWIYSVDREIPEGAREWIVSDGYGADGKWFTQDDLLMEYSKEYRFGTTSATFSWQRPINTRGEPLEAIYPQAVQLTLVAFQDGAPAEKRYFSSWGSDAHWGTADDVMYFWEKVTTDAVRGSRRKALVHGGSDQIIGTNDDVRSDTVSLDGGLGTEALEYTGAGSDATWFTSDDVGVSRNVTWHDHSGATTASESWLAGLDGAFETSDDVLLAYAFSQNLAAGRLTTFYAGPGTDGAWQTGDDLVLEYRLRVTDETERDLTYVLHDAGLDGLWGTADDDVDWLQYLISSATTLETGTVSGGGYDGVWGTADDVRDSVRNQTWANGRLSRIYNFERLEIGADGLPDTADDLFWETAGIYDDQGFREASESRSRVAVDSNNSIFINSWSFTKVFLGGSLARGYSIREKTYREGADGLPHTADDELVLVTFGELRACQAP